ncbi:hypothetical protein EV189_1989 [Motilibacter rhizosphaerae]|uniref:Integral membrane protein n=1 Tax=Motilibacter rhizosphaerae TaxID=598652 RepID=A0A4Q7NT20_9ACTN|nr:hypothetical protein [Motilibacter rhizosphaerae]RZS90205.1 hypothetical protein EV189_1989 [Motilibacter rhizosphaerae]
MLASVWDWLARAYEREIDRPGKEPLLLLLAGLVAGFGGIRTSTRLIRSGTRWWFGNVRMGGVHVHHAVFGVVLLLVTGALGFTVPEPGHVRGILALAFGVGAGLVLDEFALILHLEDVYWTREGRRSIDAVIVAVVLGVMLVVGANPYGVTAVGDRELTTRWAVVVLVVVNLLFTVVTALKGKPWLALLSLSVTVVGMVGALRLARAGSPWARWRYADRPQLLAAAQVRDELWEQRKQRYVTLLAGAHDLAPRHRPHL